MSPTNRPPSVDKLARSLTADPNLHTYAVEAARAAVEDVRAGRATDAGAVARSRFDSLARHSVVDLVNMSGVVLHTGLGRARLAPSVAQEIARVAASHTATEFDMSDGSRGNRQDHVKSHLCALTGAEDALVVNNCAGALILALAATCSGRGVVLSRGQMVEIGGAFRVPDVIRQSGCQLVEVGCTNRTHLSDYASAINEDTGAILRCHQSNFAQIGFVHSPEPSELAKLAHANHAIFLDDMGSGCLVDTLEYGLPAERTLAHAVADGADIVMASGDKLLGGPQAGILVGKRDTIAACARHPLARALRVDKLTLAGLEATLRLYREGNIAQIPVWRSCSRKLDDIKKDAQALANAYKGRSTLDEGTTEVGGGSMPGVGLPTWRVGLQSPRPESLLASLRSNGVIGRIEGGLVWLDARTADASEVASTATVLAGIAP